MPRQKKFRFVEFVPENRIFLPGNISGRMVEEIILNVEEVEAIRLSDLEDLSQEACASKMNVSRGTFQRIVNCARKKVADALVNGKVIKIQGGNYTRYIYSVQCANCGYTWEEPYESVTENKVVCPNCNSNKFTYKTNQFGNGHCKRGRHGRRWQ